MNTLDMRKQVFIMVLTSLLIVFAMLMRAKYGKTMVNKESNIQQEQVDTTINQTGSNNI